MTGCGEPPAWAAAADGEGGNSEREKDWWIWNACSVLSGGLSGRAITGNGMALLRDVKVGKASHFRFLPGGSSELSSECWRRLKIPLKDSENAILLRFLRMWSIRLCDCR